ncbi:Ku protein [Streptomyces sp. NPDC002187]|uniref:Ku protein n=1 Tax=Streptomyces sp. NPDC002187 TaxID=3364637 RepID=UPI00367C1D6B
MPHPEGRSPSGPPNRYRKVCHLVGEQLRDDEIIKGYEIGKETLVPVTDEALDQMPFLTADRQLPVSVGYPLKLLPPTAQRVGGR